MSTQPTPEQAAPAESLVEWVMRATPAEINAADWRVVLQGLLRARKELESTGVTHSWIGPYIDIARQRSEPAPQQAAPAEPPIRQMLDAFDNPVETDEEAWGEEHPCVRIGKEEINAARAWMEGKG